MSLLQTWCVAASLLLTACACRQMQPHQKPMHRNVAAFAGRLQHDIRDEVSTDTFKSDAGTTYSAVLQATKFLDVIMTEDTQVKHPAVLQGKRWTAPAPPSSHGEQGSRQ